ncbi:hypothetical protein, partial [Psychrobacter sp. Choline-3u-12]|uniref:hypothetical protein n=1 Tax=Psychrobacter sp. Choline-3u-12 TaxID=2058312 RepID=UPI001D0D7D78
DKTKNLAIARFFLGGMFGSLDGVLKCCVRFRGYQSYYKIGANPAIRDYLMAKTYLKTHII